MAPVLIKLGSVTVTLLILLPRGVHRVHTALRKRLRALRGAGMELVLKWPTRLLTIEHPTLAFFMLKITIPTVAFLVKSTPPSTTVNVRKKAKLLVIRCEQSHPNPESV